MPDRKQVERKDKASVPHEAILLSRIISDRHQIKVTFLDGDFVIDHLRWHTHDALGLKSGRVVNKGAVKYWEPIEE